MTRRAPLVIAHRGASAYRPEHTRSAYELAIDLGADAVEPDVVATRDGVLVVRHENEISGTTDVADRPEFASRRTTKSFAGHALSGWFTEDFTWQELSTLRARERIPRIRPDSAAHDGAEPILRLADVLDIVAESSQRAGREVGVVLEIKHDSYFRSIGHDLAALVDETLRASGWRDADRRVTFESFEQGVLRRLQDRGLPGSYVYLVEREGSPVDLLVERGAEAPTYAQQITPSGLDELARWADGISVAKSLILRPDGIGRATGPGRVVADAHARGLLAFAWTCRPENAFLLRQFRAGGGRAALGDYRAEWSIIREAGVDGVFVDHTDLGVEFFR